jgi:hypothetical protein
LCAATLKNTGATKANISADGVILTFPAVLNRADKEIKGIEYGHAGRTTGSYHNEERKRFDGNWCISDSHEPGSAPKLADRFSLPLYSKAQLGDVIEKDLDTGGYGYIVFSNLDPQDNPKYSEQEQPSSRNEDFWKAKRPDFVNQVHAFYKERLAKEGWKLDQDEIDHNKNIVMRFSKDTETAAVKILHPEWEGARYLCVKLELEHQNSRLRK